jgi:formamidopyrimidine-DNA glycosylase
LVGFGSRVLLHTINKILYTYLMPELPEVENIRIQLARFLVGHKITEIEVRWPKIFTGEKEKAIGTSVIGIRRYGKVLV